MQSTVAHLCSTWGSFCGAVLGQSAQILSGQRLLIPLSHAVDCGSPVLHVREFLWSGPSAVTSNSQRAALPHPLVTCSRPRLACAPRSTWECFSRICSHLTQDLPSLIPLSCHMREINQTNHSLSFHSPPNQTPCCLSNFFPRTIFKKVCFTSLTFPAQLIEQWCHCYFSMHNSTCPSHPYPRKKK